jgi:hypothetical protein
MAAVRAVLPRTDSAQTTPDDRHSFTLANIRNLTRGGTSMCVLIDDSTGDQLILCCGDVRRCEDLARQQQATSTGPPLRPSAGSPPRLPVVR